MVEPISELPTGSKPETTYILAITKNEMFDVFEGLDISDLSFLNPRAFLFFSITSNHINPQNKIKLQEKPKSQIALCDIKP
jgi:hypothetical protein